MTTKVKIEEITMLPQIFQIDSQYGSPWLQSKNDPNCKSGEVF